MPEENISFVQEIKIDAPEYYPDGEWILFTLTLEEGSINLDSLYQLPDNEE